MQDFYHNSHNNNNHRNSLTCANNWDGQDYHIEDEEHGHQQQWPDTNKPNVQNPPVENEILFISRVSHLIAQRKKEYRMLVENNQDLIKEKDELILKRDKAKQNFSNFIKRKNLPYPISICSPN